MTSVEKSTPRGNEIIPNSENIHEEPTHSLNDLDKVIKIVAEEGREARNLLTWNVLINESKDATPNNSSVQSIKKMKKPPLSPKSNTTSSSTILPSNSFYKQKLKFPYDRRKVLRMRSVSAERNPKYDLSARYWTYLFENLQQSVDKIYQTCDADESIIECKETIMILENYIKEFNSLIEWLNLNKSFEKSAPMKRPTSLTWEIKKSSLNRTLPLSPTVANKLSQEANSSCKLKLLFNDSLKKDHSTQTDKCNLDGIENTSNLEPKEIKCEKRNNATRSKSVPLSNDDTQAIKLKTESLKECKTDLTNGASITNKAKKLSQKVSLSVVKDQADPKRAEKSKSMDTKFATEQKVLVKDVSKKDTDNSQPAFISLSSDLQSEQKTGSSSSLSSTSSNSRSWADKVKGISEIPSISESVNKNESIGDNDGWETVQRYKHKLKTPPPMGLHDRRYKSDRSINHYGSYDHLNSKTSQQNSAIRNSRRRSRHSCEKLILKDKPKQNVKSSEKQIISVKSMPSLNSTRKNGSQTNLYKQTSKKAGKDVKAIGAKTKSLPDVNNSKKFSSMKKSMNLNDDDTGKPSIVGSLKDENCVALDSPETEIKNNPKATSWADLVMMHEAKQKASVADVSWVDSIEQSEMRQPGRALHMHEKLSSPSRKKSISEKIRRHEEKQAKAQELRERILEEKAQKLRDQSKKIEEIRALKEEIILKKKGSIEQRLKKAEQKREKQIQLVKKKAHDEEEKVNEIAFINSLEAQNKRLDVLSRHKDHEARLQDIQEERQRRLEEKAAKEVAAEERRKALEIERLCRLQEIQEKRKKKDMKIEKQFLKKEKERQEQAREKAREREQRLSALTAAQNAIAEELQRKIKIKQEESARRHEENIEMRRLRAFELSVRKYSSNNDDAPRLLPYHMTKICTLCNVLISSEVHLLSHLRGKAHREAVKEKHDGKELVSDEMETFNLKLIVDAPADKVDPRIVQDKERQKSLKKRCKKIKHRMVQRANEYENIIANKTQQIESSNKAKLARCIKDINKNIQNQGNGPWSPNQVSSLERSLGEIERILVKNSVSDQIAFRLLGGLLSLIKLLSVILSETKDLPAVIPSKVLVHVGVVFKLACVSCRFNCNYVLYSNAMINLIEITSFKLNNLLTNMDVPSRSSPTLSVNITYCTDPVNGQLMELIGVILSCLSQQTELSENKDSDYNGFQLRARDVVSYIVSIGIIDRIFDYFKTIQGSIDNDVEAAEFIHQSVLLLTGVVKLLPNSIENIFVVKKFEDVTQLKSTLMATEIVGTVSMLYGILLYGGAASPESKTPPPELPNITTNVALAVLRMLHHVAILDLNLFQNVIGREGTSLEFRHISSYLMWYCSHWFNEELLNELIILIGYFTVLNPDNQVVLQSGHYPTVLQQLCALPFHYFSEPMLTMILFPSLISCCHKNNENKEILEQDMSCSLLANFIEGQQISALQADLLPSKTVNHQERFLLKNRFPEDKWNESRDFFEAQ